MKRYNSFSSLKENSNKNLSISRNKPSVEYEIKKFINLLKTSVINDKEIIKETK